MRILVAGGLGVLGRRVVPSLVRQGHTVFATTRSPTRVRALEQLDAHPIVADVLDDEAWDGATQRARPEVVLHLLTDLGTGDPTSNAHLRAVGTQSLVGAADRAGARVVAESISWVNPPSSAPADEATPLYLQAGEPRWTTIAGVAALEAAVIGSHGVVLRCGQLYGPGTWFAREGRHGLAARAGSLVVPSAVASFVEADDAARAFVQVLAWTSGLVNIVDDEPAGGREWGPAFAAAVGGTPPQVDDSNGIGRPVRNRAARQLGWDPSAASWREGFTQL